MAGAAASYGGVLSRSMLAELGVDSHAVAREVAADRWAVLGRRTVAVHRGPLEVPARWWRAVWEVGCGARLDGVSALQAVGLKGFTEALVHVSVPHGSRPAAVEGVRIHRLGHLLDDPVGAGVPRTRPALAAVRAAGWAASDRQAALVLVLPIQQRLVHPSQLLAACQVARGRRRRALVERLVADLAAGAQSLGELDFTGLCRRHGLPEPARQVLVSLRSGRVYLDVRWPDVGLAVEIDGAGHRVGLAVSDDNLRQNAVTLTGDTVLRIDLIGLRLHQDEFMTQVREAYRLLRARAA